jgi:molybdopterin converting factor small subunit
MKVRVLVMGRSYDSAAAWPEELDVSEGARLGEVLSQWSRALGEGQQPQNSCLVTVSGRHLGTWSQHQDYELRAGDEILLIAPVAGG